MKKHVASLGLRVAKNGRMIVPVMDASGTVQSLQFIAVDGSKRFLSGGKTAGGYYHIPAKDEVTSSILVKSSSKNKGLQDFLGPLS
ncbi:MAG: hypothetical protein IJU65_01960 [Desulfovibrio sp.]|nr:hypothetical protein [Desulfovibrio sp.]